MTTTEAIKVMHNDVLITYEERRDVWTFSLRGRERSADSLAKAKEAIDKVPKEKNKFERVKVYGSPSYSSGFKLEIGEITSLCEKTYGSQQAWTVFGKDREKALCSNLFPVTPNNTAIVEKILQLNKEIEQLTHKRDEWRRKLTPYIAEESDD